MKNAFLGLAFCAVMPVFAQQKAVVSIHPEQGKQIIRKKSMDSLPNIWELVFMAVCGLERIHPFRTRKVTVLMYWKL